MKGKYTLPFILFFSIIANSVLAQNIVINEILTSNTTSNTDEDGTHQDWIELYNNGASAINLSGYGLTDDSAVLNKWIFPNVIIEAGQYLLVWCSSKNRTVVSSPLHTNFKISSFGEVITLSNPSSAIVDNVPATQIPSDVSYGRFPNGTGNFVFFETSTPNAANSSAGYSSFLNPPQFSQNSGFLTSGFDLTLSSTDSGTTILYTLDGSEPDENNLSGTTYNYKNQYPKIPGQAFGSFLYKIFQTLQYSAPISIVNRTSQPNKVSTISTTYDFVPPYIPSGPIFKGNVIKAKVIRSGALSSKIITKNYYISPQGTSRFTIPVLSISLNENQLYDYEDGISVAGIDFDNWRIANPTLPTSRQTGNFERNGIENERKANIHYFVNGQEVINQDIGYRIHGAYSRLYPSKSFNLYARSSYGKSDMTYSFFTDEPYTSYDRLVVKNSGSDFYSTMFRDALNHELVKSLRMETEAYQPIISFVNGEYWGILGMRERYDNNYFKQVYDIPKDEIDLLENDGDAEEGDNLDYLNMFSYFEQNSLASDANYTYIKTRMEPESFIDYFTTNIYFQNDDWPDNNIIYWRKKTTSYLPNAPYGHDGRWRWAIHDMDSTFDDPSFDSLNAATDQIGSTDPNSEWSTLFLRKLLENNTFKIDFINRFADLMNTNFLPARIIDKIDTMSAVLAPEMNDQYFRWKAPEDNADWNYFLNKEKDFANQRPAYQRDHIRSKFGIDSNIIATLDVSDPSHGFIKMNTIDITDGTPGIIGNPYPWTGIYFHNIPVTLKAIANPGYVFSYWSGASSSTNNEITLTPTANFSITAHFIPEDPTETSIPIYFWMMDGTMANNVPFEYLNSTYELTTEGVLQYQSCLVGYPFTAASPSWRKASMERRNNPTPINYRPEANGNVAYATSDMKGLQIKQPFQSGGLENTLLFNLSTNGYKDIKLSFAAINEGAASGILVDYSVNSGTPIWITTGLSPISLSLTSAFQLFQVDFSSITSVANNSNFKIRLRFTGSDMTVDNGNRVTFNNIAVEGVRLPFGISYDSPNVFTKNTVITNLDPTISGGTAADFSVAPALPTGLSLNATSGTISGTPTVISAMTTYVVTATNLGGSTTADVVITINDIPPSDLSYITPNVFTENVAITNLNPDVSGGTVENYNVAPSLPTGLSLNLTSGVISGTPTELSSMATYVVTATNSGGSTTANVVITINAEAPNNLSYTTPNIFTKNETITTLSPSVFGGTVVNYDVVPSLPTALVLNTTTGEISGTPTDDSPMTTYNITAYNSGGNTTFDIEIKVETPLSIGQSDFKTLKIYPNPFSAIVNITGLEAIVSYQIFTLDGKLIKKGFITGSRIDFSELPSGLFLLRMEIDGRIEVKKIIKR